MEPAKIRDDVDPESPEYRRSLIIVVFLVLGLGAVGGTCLGVKINEAESTSNPPEANASQADDGNAHKAPVGTRN